MFLVSLTIQYIIVHIYQHYTFHWKTRGNPEVIMIIKKK